jgi:Tfp pilus assembly protein PilF
MKKPSTDLRDIYQTTEPPPEPVAAPPNFEMVEREIRRQRIFNLLVGLLSLSLVLFITATVVKIYLFTPEKTADVILKTPYVSAYTLPLSDQWVLEYRRVVSLAESGSEPGAKPLSAKWIKNTAYHIIMGEQALRQNDLDAAQYHLENAVSAYPEMTGIQEKLGTVYLKLQNYERAEQLLQQAQLQNPSVALLNNLGAAYMGIHEDKKAEVLFRQALELQPNLAGCYRNLALLYQRTGRTNDAVRAFDSYFSLNPGDSPLLKKYVEYLISSGRLTDVSPFLDHLRGADPLTVYLLQARCAAQLNDSEKAVRALRNASSFLSPRQTIAQMHDPVFNSISGTEPFETLMYQLELAAVSLSTNLNLSAEQTQD